MIEWTHFLTSWKRFWRNLSIIVKSTESQLTEQATDEGNCSILSRGNEQDWKEECVMWYESSVLIPDAEHLPHFCAEPPAQADSKDPKLRSLQAQTGAVTLNSCGNANRKQGTLEKKV